MNDKAASPGPPLIEPLTRREREILALLAEGLTGPEIAERLTLALSSVKSHTQHLYGKLGASSKREAVARARQMGLLAPGPALPAAADPRSAPLSPRPALSVQVTRFFGREADIAHVIEHLEEWRLVTLTGAGGVGKTRLALRVAEEAGGDYPDGAWLFELAPLSDPGRVASLIATNLGMLADPTRPVLEILTTHLHDRDALLVLDNCEHLLEACVQVADTLMHTCPRLRILATSREPLGIAGEGVFVVPSLPFPDPRHLPALERLDEYTALKLFVDRTRAVLPGYAITLENAPALARICQRLDGIPLALELAAARMAILTADQLAGRLDDAFRLLTSGSRTALPRHQTLRATIDWSYQLLSEAERRLLRRLAIFKGGCTLEAAEAVCSDPAGGQGPDAADSILPGDVVNLLGALVAKSMVDVDRSSSEGMRYRLLEMVHQYAGQKLDEAGERERLRPRHREFFLQFAQSNARRFVSRERPIWLRRLAADLDNLHVALDWSFNNPAEFELGVELLLAMKQAWFIWNRWSTSMFKAIDLWLSGAAISPALEARFLAWASTQAPCTDQARALAEQSLALSRRLGPEHVEILCFSLWTGALGGCYLEILPEHWEQAEALLNEQAALIPSLPAGSLIEPRIYQAYNLWLRAVLANDRNRHEQARAYALESVRLFEGKYDGLHLAGPYIALGETALRMGDYDEAHARFAAALRLMVDWADCRYGDIFMLLCETEFRRGDLRQAFEYCKDEIRRVSYGAVPERIDMAARIFARASRFQEAARLSGAGEALLVELPEFGRVVSTEMSTSYWGNWRTRFADVSLDVLVPDWRGRPDGAAILQAWNEGRAMTYEQMRAYVLNELAL